MVELLVLALVGEVVLIEIVRRVGWSGTGEFCCYFEASEPMMP